MKIKRSFRLICICLVIMLSLTALCSCKSRALSPDSLSGKEVGQVGDNTVYYDELYTLAKLSYKDGMTEKELWDTVSVKILDNYAKQLEDDIQSSLDSMISETFGGDRREYLDALENMSTDRYTRFNIRVELLYSQLPLAIAEHGDMSADQAEVVKYIKNNFVRVKHFMIANNNGDDAAQNLAVAQSALAQLRGGETTMNKLIGGKYNEDLLIPFDGYTFGKGSMEEAYENAAFSLAVGEFSEVVTAEGELATGEVATCYYVIERLELDEDYIKSNYDTLYSSYSDVIVHQKLTETVADLKFEPNDFARSLNILALEDVSVGVDVTLILILSLSAVTVAGVTVATVFTVRHFVKKKKGSAK